MDVGCKERKCPCRRWISCNYYVDEQERRNRLKRKKFRKGIHNWYKTQFGISWSIPDIVVNG